MKKIHWLCLLLLIFSFLVLIGCDGSDSNHHTLKQDDVVSPIPDESIDDSCTLPLAHKSIGSTPLADDINPAHLDDHNTMIPFPSDVYAYKDATSPTGVRLRIRNSQFNPEFEKIPLSIQPDNIYIEPDGENADGYSVGTSVLFEFDREIDPYWKGDANGAITARDGDETFFLLDLTTGEYLPAQAMESFFAQDKHRDPKSNVIQVMARKRFEYGRQYMAFVTMNLKDKNGNDFSCATGFSKAKSQDGSDVSDYYEPYLQYLECEKGIDRDEILSATIFTTRSRESTVGPTIDMFKTVLDDDFNLDDVVIDHNDTYPAPYIDRVIRGKMLFRDFRNDDGVIRYYPGFKGSRTDERKHWVHFVLFLPRSAKKPYPLCLYGSGIGMFKELSVLWAAMNASLGIATIAIDWPSHGFLPIKGLTPLGRIFTEKWSVYKGIGWLPPIGKNCKDMPRLLSMFTQISIDSMSMYRAVKTYFANSDEVGIRDLDTDNLSYLGISLGSLCGITAAACMPDLKGAFLHVGSVNFSKVLSCGSFLLGGVSMSMPDNVSGADYAVAMCGIASQIGDQFDGIHYVEGFRNGVPEMGTGPRPLGGTYSINDGWVTPEAGLTLAELGDLPRIPPKYYKGNYVVDFDHINVSNSFAESDNYGLVQLQFLDPEYLDLNAIVSNNFAGQVFNNFMGHNWYDVHGTLEHVMGVTCLDGVYFQTKWMHNIQIKPNDDSTDFNMDEEAVEALGDAAVNEGGNFLNFILKQNPLYKIVDFIL